MTKNIGELAGKIYALIGDLTAEERNRVVAAVMALSGDSIASVKSLSDGTGGAAGAGGGKTGGAIDFFKAKAPKNKIEELAVAAKYYEDKNASSPLKEDLKAVVKEARRNFDERHFMRDIENAKAKGYFNRGNADNGGYSLSYYGQQYVDTLPDRDALAKLSKPRGGRAKGKKAAAEKKG